MGKKYKDIEIGDIYGRWTVIGKGKTVAGRHYKQYWNCQCSCGDNPPREVNGETLKNGTSKSCGCLQKEKTKESPILQRKYNLNIGEKYNNWTIIAKGKPMGKNTNTYLCECDCEFHTQTNLRADEIVNREHCGCVKCSGRTDIIGKKFGRLTVLKRDNELSKIKNTTMYECKCECGNIKSIHSSALTSDSTKSCGCMMSEVEDLIGLQFGEVTVIRYIGKKEYENCGTNINLWECECSCGNIFITNQGTLKTGDTQSCGCLIRSRAEIKMGKLLTKWDVKYIEQYRFEDCRYKNPLPFDFAIVDNNDKPIIIFEYDGEFHDTPICVGNMTEEDALYNLQQTQLRDDIKTEYCKTNHIPLVRIPYWEFYDGNLEYILFDKLVEHRILEKIKSA